jgi:hypothetical protein
MIVAVDSALDGQIVGFALWDVPSQTGGCETQTQEPEPEPAAHAGLDQSALAEMRHILAEDARAHFGDEMKRNVWRMYTSRILLRSDRLMQT